MTSRLVSPLEGMAHTDFYELLSHYKFAIAMENAVCKDYMTEKLWRPLMVGTVPIVFGSPDVRVSWEVLFSSKLVLSFFSNKLYIWANQQGT